MASAKSSGFSVLLAETRSPFASTISHAMPDKQYTLEQLTAIGNTLSLAVAEGDHFFFIIQKADLLTPACANSLLKSMEEPPPGYHFILLTERPNQLLPTIRSRCITRTWRGYHATQEHQLFPFFTGRNSDPVQFLKAVEQTKINEQESLDLVDAILYHWIEQYKSACGAQDHKAMLTSKKNVDLLSNTYQTPIMPGSSKLFWKNLLLSFSAVS